MQSPLKAQPGQFLEQGAAHVLPEEAVHLTQRHTEFIDDFLNAATFAVVVAQEAKHARAVEVRDRHNIG